MVKISVIIPAYNMEPYLSCCLDSIINQSLKEIEIIIVDDCSTDSTASIAQYYTNKDKRIRLIIQKTNTGPMAARAIGYMAATGTYLTFCDADDTMPPHALKMLYDKAVKEDADIVVGERAMCYRGVEYYCTCESKKQKGYIDSLLSNETRIGMPGKLYRAEVLKSAELPVVPQMTYAEDWFFTLLLGSKVKKWCRLRDVVYNYSYRNGSLSHRPLTENNIDTIFHAMQITLNLHNNDSAFKDRIINAFVMMCTEFLLRGFKTSTLITIASKYQLQWLLEPERLRILPKIKK